LAQLKLSSIGLSYLCRVKPSGLNLKFRLSLVSASSLQAEPKVWTEPWPWF